MHLTIETDRENDGRWIAEVVGLPGVLAYGSTRDDAIKRVKAVALHTLADMVEQNEPLPDINMDDVFAVRV